MSHKSKTRPDFGASFLVDRVGADGAFDPGGPDRFAGRHEPRIDEMLADPVLAHVMKSDGIAPDHLRLLIAETRARLNGA